MANRNKPPERWTKYVAVKNVIEGTRFLPFKTPFNTAVRCASGRMERFHGLDLLRRVGNLGLVINLVKTDRYYNVAVYSDKNVEHYRKKLDGGGRLPAEHEILDIFSAVERFISKNENDKRKLIGVHCTHGVNRTGYLICRYMICKLGFQPHEAIRKFEEGRGHTFDHMEYVDSLLTLRPGVSRQAQQWHSIGGRIIPGTDDEESDFDPDQLDNLRETVQSVSKKDSSSQRGAHTRHSRNTATRWNYVGPRNPRPNFRDDEYTGPQRKETW